MNPITRKEMFLAAAGGQNVETPTPVTREEVFLDEIAKGGGGSSLPSTETASAGDVLSLDDNKDPQWVAPSGGGGVLVVHDVNGTLDKTWQEIHDALSNGTIVVVSLPAVQAEYPTNLYYISGVEKEGVAYNIYFSYDSENPAMTATSANGYPEWA